MAKKLLGTVAGAALALFAAATSASAIPITGGITFTGAGDFGSLNPLTATFLDFGAFGTGTGNDATTGTAGTFLITFANGSFTGLGVTFGSIKDLDFGSACTFCAATPVGGDPFLDFSGFTMTGMNLTVSSRSASTIVIDGIGTLGGNGFSPTPGQFTLSTSTTSPSFIFSYSAAASAVPEPASLFLMGSGLLAAGFGARRRKQKKA